MSNCISEIRDILLTPYIGVNGPVYEPFDNCDRLHMAFAEGYREVWKRKVNKRLPLTGIWWKDGLSPCFTTLTIKGGRGEHLFVREDFREATVDVEALVDVKTNWKKNKVKPKWLTCTLTQEEYNKIEPFLGEREEPCRILKHKRTGKKND